MSRAVGAAPALLLRTRELPADLETPLSAYLKLRRPGDPGFLLESVAGGERLARWSILGVCATRSVSSSGSRIRVHAVARGR